MIWLCLLFLWFILAIPIGSFIGWIIYVGSSCPTNEEDK